MLTKAGLESTAGALIGEMGRIPVTGGSMGAVDGTIVVLAEGPVVW